MRRWTSKLAVAGLVLAAMAPAGTVFAAKSFPTSLTSNDVSEMTTDSGGVSYVTEIGGLLHSNKDGCLRKREVRINFKEGDATKEFGIALTDRKGVFVISHPALDAPVGTDFLITVLQRKIKHATCLAVEVTVAS